MCFCVLYMLCTPGWVCSSCFFMCFCAFLRVFASACVSVNGGRGVAGGLPRGALPRQWYFSDAIYFERNCVAADAFLCVAADGPGRIVWAFPLSVEDGGRTGRGERGVACVNCGWDIFHLLLCARLV